MARPIAAVDTSVLIWLATPEPEPAAPEYRNWLDIRETVTRLEEEGTELLVPAPVLTELAAAGEALYLVSQKLLRQLSRVRVEAFDRRAAEIAGRMVHALIEPLRGTGQKPAIKYDALIAATAVSCEASRLVMAGDRYFEKLLRSVDARISVLDARKPAGQVAMLPR